MTDTIAEEILSRRQWRKAILARGACERCGKTERLHAHHIDEDSANNVLSNGECLCVWCHDGHHNRGGTLVAYDEAARNPSAETRRKISEANAGQIPWNQGAHGVQAPSFGFAGKRHSEETMAKLRGRKLTDEHRRKMSEALRGRAFTEEHTRALKASWAPGGARRIAQERKAAHA